MFEGKRFLIVEDEPELRSLLVNLFTKRGAEVREAADGKSALQLFLADRYDVVISDVRMPGGDGLTLVKEIRKATTFRPIIILCSGCSEVDATDVKDYEVSAILEKPFPTSTLLTAVEEALKVKNQFAVIFRTKRKLPMPQEYAAKSQELLRLAETQDGFIRVETVTDDLGNGISVSYWKSLEAIQNWKMNATHLEAQDKGKKNWYEDYSVEICEVLRSYEKS